MILTWSSSIPIIPDDLQQSTWQSVEAPWAEDLGWVKLGQVTYG